MLWTTRGSSGRYNHFFAIFSELRGGWKDAKVKEVTLVGGFSEEKIKRVDPLLHKAGREEGKKEGRGVEGSNSCSMSSCMEEVGDEWFWHGRIVVRRR